MQPARSIWRYEKVIGPPGAGGLPAVELLDWDQAQAWQLAFGFSTFKLRQGDGVWAIGRLGARYFRSQQVLPAPVEAALAVLDPARRLLVLSNEPLTGPDLKPSGQSLRMIGSL
jgi:hypothetical protein